MTNTIDPQGPAVSDLHHSPRAGAVAVAPRSRALVLARHLRHFEDARLTPSVDYRTRVRGCLSVAASVALGDASGETGS